MAPVTVGIRAALEAEVGLGHLSRCLALAEALRSMGTSTVFVAPDPSDEARRRIRQAGVELLPLPTGGGARRGDDEMSVADQRADALATARLLGERNIETVVVDDYGLGEAWDLCARESLAKIGAIEDFPVRPRRCDLLVDTAGVRGRVPKGDRTLVLSGPRYSLLRRDVMALRARSTPPLGPVPVVAFLGAGAPARSVWPMVLAELGAIALQGHPVTAVGVQAEERRGSSPGVEFLEVNTPLANLLLPGAVVVAAGGVLALEAAATGHPLILLELAANQRGTIGFLNAHGAAVRLGVPDEIWPGVLRSTINGLLDDQARRMEMSARGRRLIDGLGALRVATALGGACDQRISLRPATVDDADLYFDWYLDPAVREASIERDAVAYESHFDWFRSRLSTKDAILQVAMLGALPVGQVRLEKEREGWMLDYSLDPAARRQGLSGPMLRAALDNVARPIDRITAIVRSENTASLRALEGVGFAPVVQSGIQEVGVQRLVWAQRSRGVHSTEMGARDADRPTLE